MNSYSGEEIVQCCSTIVLVFSKKVVLSGTTKNYITLLHDRSAFLSERHQESVFIKSGVILACS